jgi:hypothetical protein
MQLQAASRLPVACGYDERAPAPVDKVRYKFPVATGEFRSNPTGLTASCDAAVSSDTKAESMLDSQNEFP